MSPIGDASDVDLRARVVALEQSGSALSARVDALDRWQRQVEIGEARTDEKWKNVDKRFDDLDKKIGAVSNVLQKIMWIFIGSILLAIAAFVVNGGLKVP